MLDFERHFADRAAQAFIRRTGQTFNPEETPWLIGPYGVTRRIGPHFFSEFAEQEGLIYKSDLPESGLLAHFSDLRNPDFDPTKVDPVIVDFYENTSNYNLRLQTSWGVPFGLASRFLRLFYTGRIDQMNIPPKKTTYNGSLNSEIQTLIDPKTEQVAHIVWTRTYGDQQKVLFTGAYSTCQLDSGLNVVKVAFPLPQANASVYLQPVNDFSALRLRGVGEQFGDPGFYFVLNQGNDSPSARYVKNFRQEICVSRPSLQSTNLEATHRFTLRNKKVLELGYSISPKK